MPSGGYIYCKLRAGAIRDWECPGHNSDPGLLMPYEEIIPCTGDGCNQWALGGMVRDVEGSCRTWTAALMPGVPEAEALKLTEVAA